jgi:NADPH-dependent 2,4-dienoyl-CoA reductase/sulfur reductase-like enzyme
MTVSRSSRRCTLATLVVLCPSVCSSHDLGVNKNVVDVVVYGATPSGCAAAVAAARVLVNGSVMLIEPGPRVGGMTSGGLGNTDLGNGGRELGGIAREFYERVASFYYTKAQPPPHGARCTMVEPHVAEAV